MKLYIDTSSDVCQIKLDNQSYQKTFARGRMAAEILTFIHEKLQDNGQDWPNITAITFMSGPGSFTGLRIGASIVNTLANQLQIPLFDHHGQKHQIIVPDYGRPANISTPKK